MSVRRQNVLRDYEHAVQQMYEGKIGHRIHYHFD
jgi:hypothetical protein